VGNFNIQNEISGNGRQRNTVNETVKIFIYLGNTISNYENMDFENKINKSNKIKE
jgi:hypothetical protein